MVVLCRSSVVAVLALIVVAACASDGYRKVESGVVAAGKMRVTLAPGWQRAPDREVPEKQGLMRIYSRDGLATDRLVLVPGVSPGESLFRDVSGAGLPLYEQGSGDTEIARLVAASLQAVLWDGGATLEARNVRPHGFTGIPGFLFDLQADVPGAANHRGTAGAYVFEERLFLTVFLAESPGAWERHREEAQAVIGSMVMTIRTIRYN